MLTETERVLREKARKQGLSLKEFEVLVELSEDLERFGDIHAMAFERTSKGGCALTLFSANSQYKVRLEGPRKFRRLTGLVDHSDGRGLRPIFVGDGKMVSSWEKLRSAILYEEGYEIGIVSDTRETTGDEESQNDFGSAQGEGLGGQAQTEEILKTCQS